MRYPNYPSPCLSCENARSCVSGRHASCSKWRKWWFWWWKYFQKNLGKPEPPKQDKFYYEHPDIIRKEMAKNPCEKCLKKDLCLAPCYKYLAWYDVWVKIARRRLNW